MKKRFNILKFVCLDIIIINLSYLLAFFIRFDGDLLSSSQALPYLNATLRHIAFILVIKITVFYFLNMYKSIWKYASIGELFQIVVATSSANAASLFYLVLVQAHLPRSIVILTLLLDTILIGISRLTLRGTQIIKSYLSSKKEYKRIMIIGAGQAGAIVIKEYNSHPELRSRPVVLIDDNDLKIGKRINGIPVMGNRYSIPQIAEKLRIDEIVVCIPSISNTELRKILQECSLTRCKLKRLPGIYELIDGKVSIKEIKDVDIIDLLGRDPVNVNLLEMSSYIKDKVVLVTGGGGSIGSELCRQIATFEPERLLILDIYENNAYDILNELRSKHRNIEIKAIIASVRDRERIMEVYADYQPHIVFHAAAHKHVPLMEANPHEAIKNNVFGTLNVVEGADLHGVERFIMISTDKAVNPTNVMGATKRIAEMIIQTINIRSQTEFVAVRFGNVLGSNGSVIPLFKKQIVEGGPLTVTHRDITRFFMTISEAVQLVIQAGAMARGGEIFVLDMGEPVKIVKLAEDLIKLSGFEPYTDIDIKFVGLRPGEKLYEELLMDEEGLTATENSTIFIGKPIDIDYKVLRAQLDVLWDLVNGERESLLSQIEHIVPTYSRRVS